MPFAMKLCLLAIVIGWASMVIQMRLFSRLKRKHHETYLALGEPSISNYWKTGRRFDRFTWRESVKLGDPIVDLLVALHYTALGTCFVLVAAFIVVVYLEEPG